MRFRHFVLVCTLPESLLASQVSTPLEVAERFVQALNSRRWTAAAELVDLRSAIRLQVEAVDNFRSLVAQRAPTIEEMMTGDPDMPRAVAEYLATQRRLQDSVRPITAELWPGWTAEQLQALSPAGFVAVYLQIRDRREECQRLTGRAVADSLHQWTLFGQVVKGDTAYVLAQHRPRTPIGWPVARQEAMALLPMGRASGTWGVSDLSWFPGLPLGCGH